MLTEFKLIDEIKKIFAGRKTVFKGIGDDCAVVREGKKYKLYTVDTMVDGVHFDLKLGGAWEDAGYKAVVRAISDIAAMGGAPQYILLSLMLPSKLSRDAFSHLTKGVKEAAEEYNLMLIGGDVTSSKTAAIGVTVIGESNGAPVLRSGAKEGDLIYVSGYTGLAGAGLEQLKTSSQFTVHSSQQRKKQKRTLSFTVMLNAYLRPTAMIELGQMLRTGKIATAMIDISDGLLGDLAHILEESKKGAVIYQEKLPVSGALKKSGFSAEEIYDFILNGGDDYELLFTVHQSKEKQIKMTAKKANIPLTEIGVITKKGLKLSDGKNIRTITPHSFEHFSNAAEQPSRLSMRGTLRQAQDDTSTSSG